MKRSEEYKACYKKSLYTASKRKNPKTITVTPDQVNKKFAQRGYKCSYTGIVTETKSGGTYSAGTGSGANPFKTTIDRINPRKGYIINNVDCVTWCVNQTKGPLPKKVYEAICTVVAYKKFGRLISKTQKKQADRIVQRAINTIKTGK